MIASQETKRDKAPLKEARISQNSDLPARTIRDRIFDPRGQTPTAASGMMNDTRPRLNLTAHEKSSGNITISETSNILNISTNVNRDSNSSSNQINSISLRNLIDATKPLTSTNKQRLNMVSGLRTQMNDYVSRQVNQMIENISGQKENDHRPHTLQEKDPLNLVRDRSSPDYQVDVLQRLARKPSDIERKNSQRGVDKSRVHTDVSYTHENRSPLHVGSPKSGIISEIDRALDLLKSYNFSTTPHRKTNADIRADFHIQPVRMATEASAIDNHAEKPGNIIRRTINDTSSKADLNSTLNTNRNTQEQNRSGFLQQSGPLATLRGCLLDPQNDAAFRGKQSPAYILKNCLAPEAATKDRASCSNHNNERKVPPDPQNSRAANPKSKREIDIAIRVEDEEGSVGRLAEETATARADSLTRPSNYTPNGTRKPPLHAGGLRNMSTTLISNQVMTTKSTNNIIAMSGLCVTPTNCMNLHDLTAMGRAATSPKPTDFPSMLNLGNSIELSNNIGEGTIGEIHHNGNLSFGPKGSTTNLPTELDIIEEGKSNRYSDVHTLKQYIELNNLLSGRKSDAGLGELKPQKPSDVQRKINTTCTDVPSTRRLTAESPKDRLHRPGAITNTRDDNNRTSRRLAELNSSVEVKPTIIFREPVTTPQAAPKKIDEQFKHHAIQDDCPDFRKTYLIGNQIGQGAYAIVRLGYQVATDRKVAIKTYEKTRIAEPQRYKSVKREIKLLQRMNHEHIIKIYETFETDNYIHIIMEYVGGLSLHAYLKSKPNRRLPEEEAKRLFYQVMKAIYYCHSHCITHRDIKLENILLDKENNVKLIDFGFSTCIPNDKKVKLFCGTPSYMAPEIIVKKEYCGPPIDIWACGVLLFALLSGTFPFRGINDKDLYRRIVRSEFSVPDCVPSGAKSIILASMQVDPDTRPRAKDLLNDIWLKGLFPEAEKINPAKYQTNDTDRRPSQEKSSRRIPTVTRDHAQIRENSAILLKKTEEMIDCLTRVMSPHEQETRTGKISKNHEKLFYYPKASGNQFETNHNQTCGNDTTIQHSPRFMTCEDVTREDNPRAGGLTSKRLRAEPEDDRKKTATQERAELSSARVAAAIIKRQGQLAGNQTQILKNIQNNLDSILQEKPNDVSSRVRMDAASRVHRMLENSKENDVEHMTKPKRDGYIDQAILDQVKLSGYSSDIVATESAIRGTSINRLCAKLVQERAENQDLLRKRLSDVGAPFFLPRGHLVKGMNTPQQAALNTTADADLLRKKTERDQSSAAKLLGTNLNGTRNGESDEKPLLLDHTRNLRVNLREVMRK